MIKGCIYVERKWENKVREKNGIENERDGKRKYKGKMGKQVKKGTRWQREWRIKGGIMETGI